jgi:peptidoglycan/LPS O-acetylase OafA/YrhL
MQSLPKFRTVPAGTRAGHIEFAHLLRGIAAGSVLTHHLFYMIWKKPQIIGGLIAQPMLPALVDNTPHFIVPDFGVPSLWGHFGVALFFLISGFVIPFSASALSPAGFVIARVLRIWPTYVVGFSIALACIAFNAAHSGTLFPYTERDILSHYLILPRWPSLAQPIDGIIWTLEIEIFFYGFCFLVSGRLKMLDRSIFLFAVASMPLAMAASLTMPAILRSGVPIFPLVHWASSMMQFLPFLLVGTAFHYFYQGRFSLYELGVLHAGLLTAFVLSWRFGLMRDDGWSGPLAYVIAYATFTAAFATREAIARLPQLLRRPFSGLADISYPFYVVHGILGYSIVAKSLEAGFGVALALILAITAATVLALVLHIVVECPSQTLGKALAMRCAT